MSANLPSDGRPISAAECERRWDPWTPDQVASRLAHVSAPWYVAAGWALDLYLDQTPREHDDIEIAVPRSHFDQLVAEFDDYEWDVVGDGYVWTYAQAGRHLGLHQTWLRNPTTGRYHLDVFREPHDGDAWICRRHPSITMSYSALIETGRAGIPFLSPEVVLLFKARANRPKDRRDFDRTAPLLSGERRARLTGWLECFYPRHPWLTELGRPGSKESEAR